MISSVVSIFIYDRFFALKVAVVDLKGFVDTTRVLYLEGKLTDEGVRKAFEQLKFKVESMPNNYVVITSDVILKIPGRGQKVDVTK
jgi:DNA-dependent RNA polymerase auxiliary subunit epsilon